jgi:hypothetical protein
MEWWSVMVDAKDPRIWGVMRNWKMYYLTILNRRCRMSFRMT